MTIWSPSWGTVDEFSGEIAREDHKMSQLVKRLIACAMVVLFAKAAQAQTVQQPTFRTFSSGGSVSVPDHGRAFMANVRRGTSRRVSRGVPLTGPMLRSRSTTYSSGASSMSVSRHDYRPSRNGEGSARRSRPATIRLSTVSASQHAAKTHDTAASRDDKISNGLHHPLPTIVCVTCQPGKRPHELEAIALRNSFRANQAQRCQSWE